MFYENEYQNYNSEIILPEFNFNINYLTNEYLLRLNNYELCYLFDIIDGLIEINKNNILEYNYNKINSLLVRVGLKQKYYGDTTYINLSDYLIIDDDLFSSKSVHNFEGLNNKQIETLYNYWKKVYSKDITFNPIIEENYLNISKLYS